jgi:FkbM family methyltransferase
MNNRLVAKTLALLRKSLSYILKKLPENFITFAYTTLLSPRPLRWLANTFLMLLVPKSIELPEGKLLLNPRDPVVSGALALGVYEPYYTKLFRDSLRPGMTIVDIGANLGYYTVLGSRYASRVIAFEPEPENYALLRKNIATNQLTNTTLEQVAIGDKAGSLDLYFDPTNRGKHSLLAHANQTIRKVESIPLDSYLKSHGNPNISVIKIDIEGWEAKALKGMSRTLLKCQPTLFFEFVPYRVAASGEDPVATLRHLTSIGYTLDIIDETKQQLTPLSDIERFVAQNSGKDTFINLLARHQVKD